MGSLDVFDGDQPTKVILNSGTALVDFIAGLNDVDGSGLWAKKINLGNGGLNCNRRPARKRLSSSCAVPQTNNAASLAVTGTTTAPGTPGGGLDVVVAAIKASDGSVIWSHLFGGALTRCAPRLLLMTVATPSLPEPTPASWTSVPGRCLPRRPIRARMILWVAKLERRDRGHHGCQGVRNDRSSWRPTDRGERPMPRGT
jgi:hypothetical protein